MKKSKSLLCLIAAAALSLTACAPAATQSVQPSAQEETSAASEPSTAQENAPETGQPEASFTLRVGSLKGPTSMGLVSLMDRSSKSESTGSYDFTMVTAADELLAKMISGDLDIALLPANMASVLYNKSEPGIHVIDINTLGVLYVISSGDSIRSVSDLKGRSIYLTGKGTTPDYVLNYLLSSNGLTADDVTLEYKSEPAEVASVLKEQPDAVGLLPQPFVTVACAQNDSLKIVLDLTKEWDQLNSADGSSLVTGVTVCRSDILKDHESAVQTFLQEHQTSAAFANENVKETAQLIANAGIIEKAAIAEKALPYCSITYVDGTAMKTMLQGYLKVLYDQNPQSVGGALPDDAFYFIP